jgi:hypothetical protein
VADAARAAVAELEALRGSSTNSLSLPTAAPMTSSSWRGRQRKGRRWSRQPRNHRGAVAAAQTDEDASGGGARDVCAPDGGGSPDRRGHADSWVDGDRGLYRRHDSPSPVRYHGYHEIQAIVRDVGPGDG